MKKPKKVYKAFIKSMLAKNDDWQKMLAEDISQDGPVAHIKGKAAFIEVNVPFVQSMQSRTTHQILKQGDFIVTRITTTMTMPSGKTITLNASEWFEIKDGLIQSMRIYFDATELKREMGML